MTDKTGGHHRQRVRWWSALALLRSIASSPAAAAATLRSRAATADTETPEEADTLGRRTVLDLLDDESAEDADLTPGSDEGQEDDRERRIDQSAVHSPDGIRWRLLRQIRPRIAKQGRR